MTLNAIVIHLAIQVSSLTARGAVSFVFTFRATLFGVSAFLVSMNFCADFYVFNENLRHTSPYTQVEHSTLT